MGRLPHLLLAALPLAAPLAAAPPAAAQDRRPGPPPGAVVRLEVDRTDWMLGEDVLLTLVVENRGEEPFEVHTGGDIRGTSRPVRFTVTAVREDGRRAPDPMPNQDCWGGPASDDAVEPGGRWTAGVRLSSYRVIREPGTWTVTVHHDLGWRETPAASVRLRFRPPLPFEARLLVRTALSVDDRWLGWWARDTRPYPPTLWAIRQPVYLPALREAARGGEERAVPPMGSIPTPEATRALVELLRSPRPAVAREAAEALLRRIPDPADPGLPAYLSGIPFFEFTEFDREVVAAWLPSLVEEVRAGSRALVLGEEMDGRAAGAALLALLAAPADLEALSAALARTAREDAEARAREAGRDDWTGGSYHRFMALHSLRGAVERVGRLVPPSGGPARTETEAFLRLGRLPREEAERPAGREGEVATLLGHGSPAVRLRALAFVRFPAGAALHAAFEGALLDDDDRVAVAACRRAERSGDPTLLEAVLASARRARGADHLEAAVEAAWELGDRLQGLHALVDRLDDPDLGFAAVCMLVRRFAPREGGSSVSGTSAEEMKGIQTRWRTFLAVHGREIAAGREFRAGDGFVTRDLFPPGTRYSLGGNRMGWPGE